MSMHNKLQESMRQGVILERDRVMRLLSHLERTARESLDKKLMSAGEKHIAELRFKIAEAVIAVIQMKVMAGEDPDPNAVQQGPTPSNSDDHPVDGG